jgi:predicted branched-subunit amino acid permease
LPQGWQAVLAFGLTDETFADAVGRYGCSAAGKNGESSNCSVFF